MNAPSITALVGLLLIIPISAILFSSLKPTRAALALVLGVVLFAPERAEIVLPGLPGLDKNALACLCAFIGLNVTSPERVRAARLFRGADTILVLLLLGNIVTDLVNQDSLVYGPLVIPGFVVHHGFRTTIHNLLLFAFPFWIGRIAVRSREDGIELVTLFVAFAAAYVPFVLIELRMSPQMHNWIYGYAQHDFSQTIRGSGYRPMVFMAHGLALAMFLYTAVLAAWMAYKAKQKVLKYPAIYFVIGLSVVLVAAKSFGALLFLIISVLLATFTSPKMQLRVAGVVAVLVLAYPLLRFTNNFPTKEVLEMAASYEKDRGDSLEFRFMNEDILLTKAIERPIFGWGGEGRSRVYNEEGRDACVTDGAWIIFIGAGGTVGFLSRFLLVLHPIWRASRRLKKVDQSMHAFIAAWALAVLFSVVDWIPNGMFNVLPLLIAGALSGLLDGRLEQVGRPQILAQLAAYMLLRKRRQGLRTVRITRP